MSGNDDWIIEMMRRDDLLPMITAEAMTKALEGFALPLLPDRDLVWLAMAVRRALALSLPNPSDGTDRPSNVDVRRELTRLATLAQSTWLELFQCADGADARLWDHAWRNWRREGDHSSNDAEAIGTPPDYHRLKTAVSELDWLAGFLLQAARATANQSGPWRQTESKRLRVERAHCLAPVFEAAFGQRVTANNWPSGTHRKPTAFMEFYRRMVTLAFGGRESTNLAEVVKAGCQSHRRQPAQFAEGLIPGL